MAFKIWIVLRSIRSKGLQRVVLIMLAYPGYDPKTADTEGLLYSVIIDNRIGYSGREETTQKPFSLMMFPRMASE